MAVARAAAIYLSSSSEEESETESGSGSESEFEAESEEESVSGDDEDEDDDDGDDEDDDDGDDDDSKGTVTDEERCSKVIDLLLVGQRSLNILTLEDCKAYLRKHELRISGTKDTCIKRIQEHWRVKDGNGEKLYPKSSFLINCTGDVCRGDVVLFKQRVYEKFDIVKRGGGGKVIGKRIIAGRVVNESYGGAKQQHTFTIEVLWSKGVKALPPLSPLLVKGRNLYRLKTFRQRWTNEAERSRILAEKHSRGAAARHIRTIAKSMTTNKGSKLKRKSSTTNAPPNKKRRKESDFAPGKNKRNCARKSPPIQKEAANARNSTSSAAQGHAKTPKAARTENRALSAAHSRANNLRNLDAFASRSQQSTYRHPNGYLLRECPYPHQRHPYDNYHSGALEANRGMHHGPTYNVGLASSPTVRMPHGHMPDNYHTTGFIYSPNVHGQIFNRPGYIGHACENPHFHGWRRP